MFKTVDDSAINYEHAPLSSSKLCASNCHPLEVVMFVVGQAV
jgi:hypothetical protein